MKWRVEDRGTRRRPSTAYRWIVDEEGRTIANLRVSDYATVESYYGKGEGMRQLIRNAELLAQAPEMNRERVALAIAVVSIARDAGMPDSYWETDSRIEAARPRPQGLDVDRIKGGSDEQE